MSSVNRIYLVSICVHISSPFVKVPLQDLKPENFLLANDEAWPCESLLTLTAGSAGSSDRFAGGFG